MNKAGPGNSWLSVLNLGCTGFVIPVECLTHSDWLIVTVVKTIMAENRKRMSMYTCIWIVLFLTLSWDIYLLLKQLKRRWSKLVSGRVWDLRGLPHNGCDFSLQQLSAQFSVGITPSVRQIHAIRSRSFIPWWDK